MAAFAKTCDGSSLLVKGGATAGDHRKMSNEPLESEPMNNEPLEREPIDRVRARLEALLKANAAPRCGARSKRTGKPCQGAAMPNGRCKLHGGKSTGPRTPEGLERSRRASALSPEILETIRRQLGVAHRVLDVLVPELCLQRPRVVSRIGEGVAAGVAQHVREDGEGHTGAPAEALAWPTSGRRARS
jgi:hypothetical protein